MANNIALATGNWSAAGSWGVADTTMIKTDGSTATQVTTSNLDSGTFAPGAITVDGVLLNIASRVASPSGTMTVTLRNSTLGADVTSVTINNADLPNMGTSAASPGGWIFFKFSASQLLIIATNYLIRITSSVNNQCQLYAGASNAWNLLMRTTTTGAPGANDRTFIQPELTGAGTKNDITITQDINAATDYGKIDITGTGGVVQYATGAATQLRTSGNLDVWGGGTLSIGTVGTPVPVGTAAILEFDCSSGVEFGLEIRANGILNMYGGDKTFWKSLLAADAASSATSLTIADSVDTNWKNGDSIALAATTRTPSQSEKKALSADGSGTTLTIAAITNAHTGTSPIQGEVLNLTRNVLLRPTGASQTYININATAVVNLSWSEFTGLGSATSNKRGIDVATTTGTFAMSNCTIHDSTTASSLGLNITSASGSNISVTNLGTYNIHGQHLANVATSGVQTYNGWLAILNTSGTLFSINDVGSSYSNITGVSSAGIGWTPAEAGATIGTMTGLTMHTNSTNGVSMPNSVMYGTISNMTLWRNDKGLNLGAPATNGTASITFSTATIFGNATCNIDYGNGINPQETIFDTFTVDSGVTLTCPIGLRFNSSSTWALNLKIYSSTFGNTTTHSTGDISIGGTGVFNQIYMWNTKLASSTEVASQTNFMDGSFIRSSRHDQSAGAYKAWFRLGTIESDASVFNTAAPSEKMTPNNATYKLKSATKAVAVANGQAATVSVYVRKTAAGANQPRLMVRRNDSGITSETVLDTMSVGINTWEQLSGTTVAVTEDCVLEFFVDTDNGNTVVYTDDWTVSVA